MRIPATSVQFVVVPVALLEARPLLDPVDLALTPDDGTPPGPADWQPLTWVASAAGEVLGPGLLAGPGAAPLPAGTSRAWVREHLPWGEDPVWPWERLRVGL